MLHQSPLPGLWSLGAPGTTVAAAQVLWNCPGVADGDHGRFPHDILYEDDIEPENGLPVVKLVHNPGANRFQHPATHK